MYLPPVGTACLVVREAAVLYFAFWTLLPLKIILCLSNKYGGNSEGCS